MKHIILSDKAQRPLPFYLAMEEVVARHFHEECFFTWIVQPTVIFGRHQVMDNEVNVGFCVDNGIDMVRRKSGGGCVYADGGNIMMSYICPAQGTMQETFTRYLNLVTQALQSFGIPAEITGRNDILLNGRKISGNALYTTDNKRTTIVHGSLLHSTDLERMAAAITPPTEKLAKRGISSVRQRVMNISEAHACTIGSLRDHVTRSLCHTSAVFTPGMIAETEALMRQYLSDEWLRGAPSGTENDDIFPQEQNTLT